MNENQHIEWKSVWKDEYLKVICGFANASGGVLEIGKDDKGNVVGISKAKKLMEDLPNKVRDVLGVIIEVNLHSESGQDWLSIEVDPYPSPINYKGHYYFRSGSTNQELKGAVLDRFLLHKQGRNWDSIPLPHVKIDQLQKSAIEYFKKLAADSRRVSEADLKVDMDDLLEKLTLFENGFLNRAAVLLFHSEPERFVTGASVKLGFFRTDEDLGYQDEIQGNLFQQVEKTMELLLTKYLIASISYHGIHRVEAFPYPEAALREALVNAIAHKDYSTGNPIQISVYKDKIIFWNAGVLPENWTVERLKEKHPSVPFNPAIAKTFFRAGLIEAWGRGTLKIIKECKEYGIPEPVFKYDLSGFWIEFNASLKARSGKSSGKSSEKSSEKILELIKQNDSITIAELSAVLNISTRAVEKHLSNLQKEKRLKRVGGRKEGHWQLILPNVDGNTSQ